MWEWRQNRRFILCFLVFRGSSPLRILGLVGAFLLPQLSKPVHKKSHPESGNKFPPAASHLKSILFYDSGVKAVGYVRFFFPDVCGPGSLHPKGSPENSYKQNNNQWNESMKLNMGKNPIAIIPGRLGLFVLAASLALFASVALLFWYVLQLVMSLSSRD